MLARFAREPHQEASVVVVTSALRASVEDSGDHMAGLSRVRQSLAAIGHCLGTAWSPSYYGKDLVLVRTGKHAVPACLSKKPPAGGSDSDVRHGWAFDLVSLSGSDDERRERLLHACYAISMAARLRRDRPDLRPCRAHDVLLRVPGLLSPELAASLLAGVLVRPLGGTDEGSGARPGEDPRFPGVPSADAWDVFAQRPPQRGLYAVSDVHDIEWGTLDRESRQRLTEGSAHELLPLTAAWLDGSLPLTDVLDRAYRLRVRRESLLSRHLRTLNDAVTAGGRLFATLGDGLSGIVSDAALMRSAVLTANGESAGHMHSGAGVAPMDRLGLTAARRRAHFSLHVTKTLKGTGHQERFFHGFGTPLGSRTADSVVGFLSALRRAGPDSPGFHHLAHALRWHDWWHLHLPPTARVHLDQLCASIQESIPGTAAET
ncbi:hypothetical protein SAMN06272775_6062 [Streptomyces sp. 2323.1]|uniref:hypothetical protein n=1 Tax=Streptomyces sp. 2323.1 TaxID=1938841 RepID=UPI000BBF56B6|nr:hypothetical protein [Streptomyces sp. 2323.1]SOE15130.1 hypothetical protein SAMN06272775_6062 [Streptomyces sp. 2323.1]